MLLKIAYAFHFLCTRTQTQFEEPRAIGYKLKFNVSLVLAQNKNNEAGQIEQKDHCEMMQ